MSKIPRFAAYAAAFEKSFASDDWSLLEPFFTEDAVYDIPVGPPLGGRIEGRAAILAWFKDDPRPLRPPLREPRAGAARGPEGDRRRGLDPRQRDLPGAGVPEFVLELEETVTFDGDRIRLLEDHYEPAMQQASRTT